MGGTEMNETDKITECPYCNGAIVNGKCIVCEWRPEYELPPDDSWEGRFGEEE
jgi:hypothetical protein